MLTEKYTFFIKYMFFNENHGLKIQNLYFFSKIIVSYLKNVSVIIYRLQIFYTGHSTKFLQIDEYIYIFLLKDYCTYWVIVL